MVYEIEHAKVHILERLGFWSAGNSYCKHGLTVGELASGVFGAVKRRERKLFNKALDELVATGRVKRTAVPSGLYYTMTTPLDLLSEI